MSSNEPKNKKLKGNFHINIESNTNQNSQKGELKSIICDKHPTQTTQGNILTTATSMHKGLLEDDHLDTSENIILSPNIQNNIAQKMNQKYSFSKDYFDEVYQNLLLDEQRFYQKINCNYMIFQKDINDKMRAILVDWLIDIHYKLNMKKKTLYQCVFIIDAFLSKISIERKKLQLLGTAALLIACKEIEIIYPTLETFLAFSNNSYTLKELRDMEIKILQELDFDILSPTSEEFFDINADYFEFTEKQRFFGEYFLDASLIDYHLLKYKQSTIAVACGYIVLKYFDLNGINLIANNTNHGVNQKEIKDCAIHLCFLIKNLSESSLEATKNKYMSYKYMNVAQLCKNN